MTLRDKLARKLMRFAVNLMTSAGAAQLAAELQEAFAPGVPEAVNQRRRFLHRMYELYGARTSRAKRNLRKRLKREGYLE